MLAKANLNGGDEVPMSWRGMRRLDGCGDLERGSNKERGVTK